MKKKPTNARINVRGTEIAVIRRSDEDYISLTDMRKAKDGDFFIADWLRNRNTVEFPGIWETVHNPDFNYGEFAIIKSQAGLNRYKLSVKKWVEKTNAIGLQATAGWKTRAPVIETEARETDKALKKILARLAVGR